MKGISVAQALELLSAKSCNPKLKAYLNKECEKARAFEITGNAHSFCDRGIEEFKHYIEERGNVVNSMPVITIRSGYTGAVMADGNVWNPYIHRRFLPSKVLSRVAREAVKRGPKGAFFSNYFFDLTWWFTGGGFDPRPTDNLDIVNNFLENKTCADLLKVMISKEQPEGIKDVKVEWGRYTRHWMKSWYRRVNHFLTTETNVIRGMTYGHIDMDDVIPSRYFVRGLIIDGEQVPMEKVLQNAFDQITDATFSSENVKFKFSLSDVALVYATTGIWGAITAMRTTPELCGSFMASEVCDIKADKDVWGTYLTTDDLYRVFIELYRGVYEEVYKSLENQPELKERLSLFSEGRMVISSGSKHTRDFAEETGLPLEDFVDATNAKYSVEKTTGYARTTRYGKYTPPVYDPSRETVVTQWENGPQPGVVQSAPAFEETKAAFEGLPAENELTKEEARLARVAELNQKARNALKEYQDLLNEINSLTQGK